MAEPDLVPGGSLSESVLLIHGGLWEDDMNADRFWAQPGIVGGLRREGLTVLAPNRLLRPLDWHAEANHLVEFLPEHPVTVVAGSNGCSAAVRLALDFPNRVARLLLAWPATAGDIVVDVHARAGLIALGAADQHVRALLDGQTLRGVTDNDLATLTMPVSLLPSTPQNPLHQRRTVDSLRQLLPRSEEWPGCPEPPHPDFSPHLGRVLGLIATFADR